MSLVYKYICEIYILGDSKIFDKNILESPKILYDVKCYNVVNINLYNS